MRGVWSCVTCRPSYRYSQIDPIVLDDPTDSLPAQCPFAADSGAKASCQAGGRRLCAAGRAGTVLAMAFLAPQSCGTLFGVALPRLALLLWFNKRPWRGQAATNLRGGRPARSENRSGTTRLHLG